MLVSSNRSSQVDYCMCIEECKSEINEDESLYNIREDMELSTSSSFVLSENDFNRLIFVDDGPTTELIQENNVGNCALLLPPQHSFAAEYNFNHKLGIGYQLSLKYQILINFVTSYKMPRRDDASVGVYRRGTRLPRPRR